MPVGVGGWDKAISRRRKLGGAYPCDPLVMGAWGTGGCGRCSAIELGIKLGVGFGRAKGKGKNFSTCWPGWRGLKVFRKFLLGLGELYKALN